MAFNLLQGFERIFAGQKYRHRSSTQGDRLARLFYEDLYLLRRSRVFQQRVDNLDCVVNVADRVTGIRARRGDGTFGESLPGVDALKEEGFYVCAGPTANVQIGVEVKVLATAMIKQIDRVISDLRHQSVQFKSRNTRAITVAILGVNHATKYSSYEGKRVFRAEGTRAPALEAPKAIRRLEEGVRADFDELIVLRFDATNAKPYPFAWVYVTATEKIYGAALIRVLRLYEARFNGAR
jgi:hypothetical protein